MQLHCCSTWEQLYKEVNFLLRYCVTCNSDASLGLETLVAWENRGNDHLIELCTQRIWRPVTIVLNEHQRRPVCRAGLSVNSTTTWRGVKPLLGTVWVITSPRKPRWDYCDALETHEKGDTIVQGCRRRAKASNTLGRSHLDMAAQFPLCFKRDCSWRGCVVTNMAAAFFSPALRQTLPSVTMLWLTWLQRFPTFCMDLTLWNVRSNMVTLVWIRYGKHPLEYSYWYVQESQWLLAAIITGQATPQTEPIRTPTTRTTKSRFEPWKPSPVRGCPHRHR